MASFSSSLNSCPTYTLRTSLVTPSVSGIKGDLKFVFTRYLFKGLKALDFGAAPRILRIMAVLDLCFISKKPFFLDKLSVKLDHITIFEFIFQKPVLVTSYISWEGINLDA